MDVDPSGGCFWLAFRPLALHDTGTTDHDLAAAECYKPPLLDNQFKSMFFAAAGLTRMLSPSTTSNARITLPQVLEAQRSGTARQESRQSFGAALAVAQYLWRNYDRIWRQSIPAASKSSCGWIPWTHANACTSMYSREMLRGAARHSIGQCPCARGHPTSLALHAGSPAWHVTT